MNVKLKILIALIPVLVVALALALSRGKEVLQVNDDLVVSFDSMIRDVKHADVVFIGEVHDMQEHHEMELRIIKALHEADTPLVIGLEMFRADSQKALDSWIAGSLSVDRFKESYYDNWRQPWAQYRDIFYYLREHEIPAMGLNIPDGISEEIALKGFEGLSRKQKEKLPPGISCDVDPTYMRFIRRAYSSHAKGNDRTFLNFCEAQMVWDKAMAWDLVDVVKKHPGKRVLVLCGVGHAWKRGIPGQIAKIMKYDTRVIMPLIPAQIDPDTVSIKDADYVVLR